MAVIISGILRSPANAPMPDIDIILNSLETSRSVLATVESKTTTKGDGSYHISVPPGFYNVLLARYGQRPATVGKIRVFEDSLPGDLNTYLDAPVSELAPAWFRDIEAEREKAEVAASASKASEQAAAGYLGACQGEVGKAASHAARAELEADRAARISGVSTVQVAVALAIEEGRFFAAKWADMEAMRAYNLQRFAASGFVHMGQHNNAYVPVNQGMTSYDGRSNYWINQLQLGVPITATNNVGNSKELHPQVHIAGFVSQIKQMNRAPGEAGNSAVKFPGAEAGTCVYDSATGQSIDYRYDVDPKYGDVAATHNEAASRAWEGDVKNGDFRFGDDGSWSVSGGVIIDNTGAQFTASGSDSRLRTHSIDIAGNDIVIEFTCDVAETIALYIYGGDGDDATIYVQAAPGKNTVRSLAANRNDDYSSNNYVMFRSGSGSFSGKISNVSIRLATQEVVTDRVDLSGLEGWLERVTPDNPIVYPNGLIQSQAATMDGIPTVTSNRPDSYYAVCEGDVSSRGKGVNIFTATVAQADALFANPWNNLWNLGLDNDGKPIVVQWRIRQRTIRGAGNGDWGSVDAASGSGLAYQISPFYKGIMPQGARDTVQGSHGSTSDYFVPAGHAYAPADTQKGIYRAVNASNTWPGAYNSLCFFLPICAVPRLNQGAYHPSLNPAGTAKIFSAVQESNYDDWHVADRMPIQSPKDCFDLGDYPNTGFAHKVFKCGFIGKTSGRPDGRLYDAIYASGLGGVDDLRLSAWGVTGEDYARVKQELIAGTYRGAEKLVRMRKAEVFDSLPSNSAVGGLKWADTGETVLWSDLPSNLKIKQWLKQDGNNTQGISSPTYRELGFVSTNTNLRGSLSSISSDALYVYLAQATIGEEVLVPCETNLTVSGEFQVTEVIGDPANILQCDALKDGWLGVWNPTIPDGVISDFKLTWKYVGSGTDITRTYTGDAGVTWTSGKILLSDVVKNATAFTVHPVNQVTIYNYLAFAAQVEECDNSPVQNGEAGIGNVWASKYFGKELGSLVAEALIGKVLTSNQQGDRVGCYTLTSFAQFSDGRLSNSDNTAPISHSPLTLVTPANNSPAVKFLDTRSVVNDQAFLDLHFMELKHDGTDWGDSGKIVIADKTSTYTNDNGETLLCGTKRMVKPMGWFHNKH
ncbi:prophage tail fiber N-terminal domain-containing protein [Photobacterium sp. MCCC 1A19761]|uniref:prophage tail fiber N-terminal domain-containing protein n=1 Tax=Photobacterium sp. MCCC 1A19761 TaxID=3115000 RepID=UPI00307EA649